MPRIADPSLRAVFEDPGLSLAAKGALAFVLTRHPSPRNSGASRGPVRFLQRPDADHHQGGAGAGPHWPGRQRPGGS
jgi:hypothetical protein